MSANTNVLKEQHGYRIYQLNSRGIDTSYLSHKSETLFRRTVISAAIARMLCKAEEFSSCCETVLVASRVDSRNQLDYYETKIT